MREQARGKAATVRLRSMVDRLANLSERRTVRMAPIVLLLDGFGVAMRVQWSKPVLQARRRRKVTLPPLGKA